MHEPRSDFISDLEMMSTDIHRSFVAVEGERDFRSLNPIFRGTNTIIHYAKHGEGKHVVIECIQRINELKRTNVVGVVDADFDRILNSLCNIENLIYTETHDLEIDILKTGVLERAFDEIISPQKTSRKLNISVTDLPNHICHKALKQAFEFGLIHLIVYKAYNEFNDELISGKFAHMPKLRTFCRRKRSGNKVESRIDIDRYIKKIQKEHPSINISKEISKEKASGYPIMQIVRGRDVIFFISLYISEIVRGQSKKTAYDIESYLRMSFNRDYFAKMKLCTDLYDWAKGNDCKLSLPNCESK